MESPHQPPESKNPGLIGLGLLLVLGLGLGLAHWFHPPAPEADRVPIPSVSSVFSTPAKLVVYQEGPAIPQLWLDTFSSGPGFPKIDLRILSRNSDGTWPTDGDVYLLKARFFPEVGKSVPWADLTGQVPIAGINPVYQGQSFDPLGTHSRPWRISPWFFMKKVAPGTSHKVAFAAPVRWASEPQSFFPNEPDLMAALWIKSQGKSINLGGEPNQQQARQQAESALAGKLIPEEECWEGLKDGRVQLTYLPAWRLVLEPQAGNGLIRWSALQAGTIVDFEVMAIAEASPKKEMAIKFLEFLIAPPQQAALLGATGYFPVRSKPGKEWEGSSMAMPAGPWFDRSEFILWPYPKPVVSTPPPTSTGTNEITPSAEGGMEKAESETRKAENSSSR